MGRRPPPGYCLHCLRWHDDLTWDHVFPQSWYPDDTPHGIEKWKIPACRPCNAEHGRSEEELLLALGLCTSPADRHAAGITNKVLRSIDPSAARNRRDRAARLKKRARLLREIRRTSVPPQIGVLPNFGPQPGLAYPHYALVTIPARNLIKLGDKLVRGITYLEFGAEISGRYMIETHVTHDENAAEIDALVRSKGTQHYGGPGVTVVRAAAVDDPVVALFHIDIWGRLRLRASVLPRDGSETAGPAEAT